MQKKTEEDGWQRFLELCFKAEEMGDLDELFGLLLTPQERSDLSARCLIVQALLEGRLTQREIAKELGVSIAKITRGSNFLKTIGADLRRKLEK